jgi:tetratricopeptide (TPR) repeat protein
MTDQLHELIRSLTKSEKRYFKLMNLSEKVTSYERLFNALEGMVEYDELALRNELKGQRALNQLHVAKNYLYKQILRSLRSFHAGTTPFIEFAEHVADMQILHAKGLFDQSKKALKKARVVAEDHDDDLLRLQVSLLDRDRVSDPVSKIEASEVTLHHRLKLLERLRRTYELKSSLEQFYDRLTLQGQSANRSSNVLETNGLEGIEIDSMPFMSQVDYCSFKCYVHFDRAEYLQAAEWIKRAIDLFDEHPLQRERSKEIYLSLASNYLTCLLNTDRGGIKSADELNSALSIFDRVEPRSRVHKTRAWAARRLAQFEWAFVAKDDELLRHLLPQFIVELDSNRRSLSELELSWFYFTLSKAYYWTGDLNASLQWINKLLDTKAYQSLIEYYTQAMVLSAIIHHSLGNLAYVPVAVRSAERFMDKHARSVRIEIGVLSLLESLANKPDLDAIQAFTEILSEVNSGPITRNSSRFFEFDRWIVQLQDRIGEKSAKFVAV